MRKRLEIGKLMKGDKRLDGETFVEYKERLKLEKEAKRIVGIDTRYKDGLWYQQTVDYADGRRITEYRDSRKKTIEENRYGEDVE